MLPVASKESRGDERQHGVLHAAIREGGREHQEIVAAPHIGPKKSLCCRQHRLSLGKLEESLVN